MGLLAICACLICSGIGLLTAGLVLHRHGLRWKWAIHAIDAVLGAILIWAWAVLLISLLERTYARNSFTVIVLGLLGALGLVLIAAAFNAALKPNHHRRPGHCRNCGYDMNATPDALICPECGRKSRPAERGIKSAYK